MSGFGLLQILKASGKITTQDLGRKGWLHLGICESGAADEMAFLWANFLVGNVANRLANSTTLEITLGQVSLIFTAATTAALTGASTPAFLNDKPIPCWQSFRVAAGDVLRLSLPKFGLINYLAVQNGFKVQRVCGSTSICEREGLGPFNGRQLQVKQCIGYSVPNQTNPIRSVPAHYIPEYHGQNIPFMPAEKVAVSKCLSGAYFTVTPATNRMGCRLEGQAIEWVGEGGTQCVSQGMPYGAIQLPPDGQPIALLKDRQTMGGYLLLGCLSRFGGGRLAQCRPGERVSFVAISRMQAIEQLRQRNVFFGL
ncbi:biotin-dependent carboxyltransferase family protein [Marinagarivorans cellulosilyticus]|uniref:Carboxyltransferase domain-containing protein n=1 Tax=Marinagarivorans cellulosilyticus TaxID=2721545 RepID=A0AAN1WHF9_9GAMM|nr:biotin-dependent carboxyltransferase family protein [Marinagarivorans cellulosilyticus]BCD97658.1 hypothetical protein MARGE09_P1859 [Marinagarivorans cellulosilyticus]